MIGLVVLTHGQMAVECLRTAEMIIGPVDRCCAISIDRSRSVVEATNDLSAVLAEVGTGDEGVLIMTDMFGGTPTNIAVDFLASGRVEILTGFNLPLLIKAVSARHEMALDDLTVFLREYGQKAILRPVDFLQAKG